MNAPRMHTVPLQRSALTLLAGLLLTGGPVFAKTLPPEAPATSSAPVPAVATKTGAPMQAAGSNGSLGDFQLSNVRLDEAARLLSQAGNTNVVVTRSVADQEVSLYLRNATVEYMIRNLCRAAGVWFRYDTASKTYILMNAEEYQKDLSVVRDEKTRVITLRHHNVVAAANAVRALFGSQVILSNPVEEVPPVTLNSSARTNTTNSRSGSNASSSASMNGNNAGTANNSVFGSTQGSGSNSMQNSFGNQAQAGGSQGVRNYDPGQDFARLSQDRIDNGRRAEQAASGEISVSDLQTMAARQGPPVYLTYNKLNNLLMVRTGDESLMEQIVRLVAELDRPPRQVLLEMKILEVELGDGFRSVFDIGQASGKATGPTLVDGSSSGSRNILSTGMFGLENDATALWQIMSKNLTVRLQLLANDNKVKVLSSPMLVAANNQPARLFIGDERVLVVGATSESVTSTAGTNTTITAETERRNVGQTLSILPRINDDRSISLTIDQDSSTVKAKDTTIPIATSAGTVIDYPIDTVNTATLQVTAHARDGLTVAVGGMIRDETSLRTEKVPMLGDIPALGFFFKRDVRSVTRSQIVLLITPRVLENPEESDNLARRKQADLDELGDKVRAGKRDNPLAPRIPQDGP